MRGQRSPYPYPPTAEGWRSPAGILSNSVTSRLRQESGRHISASYQQHRPPAPAAAYPHWNSSIKAQTHSCTSVRKQSVSTSRYQQTGPACQAHSEAQVRRKLGKGEVGEP